MVPPTARVTRIGAARAVEALAGLEALDPRGMSDAADLVDACERGECFELEGAVNAVYVVSVRRGVCWVQALKATGPADATGSVLPVIDAVITAQAEGVREIAFQTKRPGLRRQLERRGFTVAGWIMKKELDHGVRR